MLFVQISEMGYQVNNKFYKTAPTFMVQSKTKILNLPVSERQPPNRLPLYVLTDVWLMLQIYIAK